MRPTRRLRVPGLEWLEPRQVLAAGGVITFEEGVLSIVGTNKNDRVAVTLEGENLRVTLNQLAPQWFTAADVTGLHIDAGRGNDKVVIDNSVLIDAWISGGAGNDDLRGGGGNDQIFAGAGNDKADGGGGDDQVFGESGHDKLFGGEGHDWLDGGAGFDHLKGGAGNDHLDGGAGKDHLHGEGGDDELLGGGDNDKLVGGTGNDSLDGGGGQDQVWGDAGNDTLHGGEGKDHLRGGWGDDELFGEGGNDHLWGDAGNDWLQGDDGHDQLKGGDGDDQLKGGLGNDHLDGGAGTNLLDGDEGKNKLTSGDEFDFDVVAPDEFQPLLAALSGQLVTGDAVYERQTIDLGLETFVQIYVHGAAPGLDLLVSCGSCFLGHLLTDGDGFGELRLSSLAGEEGGFGLPTGFAPVAGDALSFVDSTSGQTIITGVFENV